MEILLSIGSSKDKIQRHFLEKCKKKILVTGWSGSQQFRQIEKENPCIYCVIHKTSNNFTWQSCSDGNEKVRYVVQTCCFANLNPHCIAFFTILAVARMGPGSLFSLTLLEIYTALIYCCFNRYSRCLIVNITIEVIVLYNKTLRRRRRKSGNQRCFQSTTSRLCSKENFREPFGLPSF